MGTFCNFISNSMTVIRNCKPELAIVPFILDPEILYGGREECSFYSSDFSPTKYPYGEKEHLMFPTRNLCPVLICNFCMHGGRNATITVRPVLPTHAQNFEPPFFWFDAVLFFS